jgi:hypothetical protein
MPVICLISSIRRRRDFRAPHIPPSLKCQRVNRDPPAEKFILLSLITRSKIYFPSVMFEFIMSVKTGVEKISESLSHVAIMHP